MTWTYTLPIAVDRDRVRGLIGDTDTTYQLLQDEEIAYFLSVRADVFLAAADSANAIAATFSRQADTTNLSLSVSASQRAEAYRNLAVELAARSGSLVGAEMFVGGLTISGKEALATDTDAVQPSFERNQDDFPGNDPNSNRYDPTGF
jgi:hypothetical protein